MRLPFVFCLCLFVKVSFGQLFVETIDLSNVTDPIPLNFKIDKVSCSVPTKDTLVNHKGWQWAIKDGLLGGITSYLDAQYISTSDQSYTMNINSYNFIVNGNKRWRSWLDVSFYDKSRNEIFRTGSWEDLESMPRTERGATLIRTLVHECISLFDAFLKTNKSLKPKTGFFLDQNGFISKTPYFNADVVIEEIKYGDNGTGMYSIIFKNDSVYEKSLGGLIYGYTDGTDIYFSTRNYQNTTAFAKVIDQGKDWVMFYHNELPDHKSLTAGAVTRNVILGALSGIVVVPYFHNYEGNVVVDFKNNEIHQATFQNLKYLINQNKTLKSEAKKVGYSEVKTSLKDWWIRAMESR